ncbi:M56 family metallopeptidase [Streptomyces azureus]|uniref:Peptidase M48 Ste24p n=1 Tax=Streptomyces azureus TaxID=146537 RepID=A0A0K8PFH1_STRAJ|nr:M56 family metallopeptidase [Streptomyces azureus]GAP46149.1 peptidase M48 Ste24p [Streptomyces azureus]
MGVFVFLPLVLPLTAWPVARLAEQHLHPRTATRLLTAMAAVLALCSTVCLGLVMVVGTAQLPGNPLPDGWSDPEVRAAVPFDEVVGKAAIPALCAVVVACARSLWRHARVRRQAHRALSGLPDTEVAVLPDGVPYAYALPGGRRGGGALRGGRQGGGVLGGGARRGGRRGDGELHGGARRGGRPGDGEPHGRAGRRVRGRRGGRVVVTTALLDRLRPAERRALFAHERAHLAARHDRFLLTVQLAARANPFLRPLRTAVAYTAERWADEEAARAVGSRRTVARAIGTAALVSRGTPAPTLAGLAAPGPVPRRVAALLGPPPAVRNWPPVSTSVGLAAWGAAAGTAVSAMSSANSAVTMVLILHAATPL